MGHGYSRRDFLELSAITASAALAGNTIFLDPDPLYAMPQASAPSERVRFGIVGVGMQGSGLLRNAIQLPGVECVAACDLYDGRHELAQETVNSTTLPVTRRYRNLLDNKEIDAIIAAVPDHWHKQIVVDSVNAGKDIYCEKPMSHTVEDGISIVEAAQKHNRMIAVGSQRVSSILYAKAKEIYDSGKLGEVFCINAYWDRNSPSGAWVYPIPPNASDKTIDWNAFLGEAPKRSFDPVRFFRWRCFTDYGEGLGGDLFVHLLSGIHFITGTNVPASRAVSAGGLFYFKDGREFPDLIETMYDYPDFRVTVRCNLNNAGGEFIAFYGSKGTMIIKDSTLSYKPEDTTPRPEDYSVFGWPKELRDQYYKDWEKEHPPTAALESKIKDEGETYTVPQGYSDTVDHQTNFFNAVRTRKPVVENEIFGNNTSIGCHLANYAYFNKCVAVWDPSAKKIVKG